MAKFQHHRTGHVLWNKRENYFLAMDSLNGFYATEDINYAHIFPDMVHTKVTQRAWPSFTHILQFTGTYTETERTFS